MASSHVLHSREVQSPGGGVLRSPRIQAHCPCTPLLLVFLSSGVTCNQCTRNADCVYCGFWYLFFYLLKNFPGLREDRLEPSSRRDFGGCRSCDEEADGAPKSRSQLICCSDSCLRGEEGGDGPSSLCLERPSPPSSPGELLLVLQDPAQAATSSRKPTLISQAVCPSFHCASMSCAFVSLSQRPACSLWLSLESVPPSRL